jgi:hypothetical protein
MAPVPGRTLRRPAKVDTGLAIGSMLRLQVPRVRMAKGWGRKVRRSAGTQAYAGALPRRLPGGQAR